MMLIKKMLQHTFICAYLLVSFNAFLYTMTRLTIPGIPWKLTWGSYGMMAPFQGYSDMNEDLLAEGKRDNGNWEVIELEKYSPMIRGNQIMHRRLMSARFDGKPNTEAYHRLAKRLQVLEAKQGNIYASIRLTWQGWPVSPEGWDANRKEELISTYLLTEVP